MRIILAFCMFLGVGIGLSAQTKRALVVAIGQYNAEWSPTSALNDTAILLPALRKQGFVDVRVLTNAKATKTNILDAISKLARAAKTGDIVWFHFSGHGQQMTDIHAPDENDGLDETLVPYGAPRVWKEGVSTDLHLRDEELGSSLSELAKVLGPSGQLLVTLDACHAGSGLRSINGLERGVREVFGPAPNEKANVAEKAYILPLLQVNTVAFYASSPAESNRECRSGETTYGSLTFALYRALEAIGPQETCFNLFDRVRQQMASLVPEQHPQMQGNGNLLLFSGKAVTLPKYVPIRKVEHAKFVWVEGGELAGLGIGSQLAFFPIGTTDTLGKTPLAIGTVVETEPTASGVNLQKGISPDLLRQSRAYLRYQNFGPLRLRVRCNVSNGVFKNELLERMKTYPNLLLNKGTFDVEIAQKDGQIILQNAAGHDLEKKSNQNADFWVEKMIAYMRGLWLRKVDFQDDAVCCEFDIVTAKKGQTRTVNDTISLFTRRDETGVVSIQAGENLVVKVRNKGTKPAYFTLLDFQPDGVINMVLQNFEQVRLEPGQTWWSDTNGRYKPGPVNPPYGTEMIKLYATEYPVDFLPLLSATRGPAHQLRNDLERLFDETRSANRSPQTSNIKTGGVSTFCRVFQIIR